MTTTVPTKDDPVECVYQYTLLPNEEEEGDPETRTHTVRGIVETVEVDELTIKADHRVIKANTKTDTVELITGPQPAPKDQECDLAELSKIELADVFINFDTHDFKDRRYEHLTEDNLPKIELHMNNILKTITEDLSNKWLTDHQFVSSYTALNSENINEKGVKTHIKEYNSQISQPEGQITFTTEQEAIIWINEILGQLSDGIWENEDMNWKHYHRLEVNVNQDQQTLTTTGDFESLNFTEKLFEYDGMVARMLVYAMLATDTTDYSSQEVREFTEQLDRV